MRAGESLFIQHKPTAMDTMIETISSKIYWFLMDHAGAIYESLHRHCTASWVRSHIAICTLGLDVTSHSREFIFYWQRGQICFYQIRGESHAYEHQRNIYTAIMKTTSSMHFLVFAFVSSRSYDQFRLSNLQGNHHRKALEYRVRIYSLPRPYCVQESLELVGTSAALWSFLFL